MRAYFWLVILFATCLLAYDLDWVTGFYKERRSHYLNFGTSSAVVNGQVITNKVYVINNATGSPIAGQQYIFSTNLGDANYSDLCQLIPVTILDPNYVANTLKDEGALLAYNNSKVGAVINTYNYPRIQPGTTTANNQTILQAWYKNQTVNYFDFGSDYGGPIPIYVFFYNSTGIQAGHNIIDYIPGDPGYSAFWLVFKVLVPNTYVPDTLFSYNDLQNSGYTQVLTTTIVNCPIIYTEPLAPMITITQGWYRGLETLYYNFGARSAYNSTTSAMVANPIYFFVDSNNNPIVGQNPVLSKNISDTNYSDLVQVYYVTVGPHYMPGSITDEQTLLSTYGGSIVQSANKMNYPVYPDGTILADGRGPLNLTTGYYKGQFIYYFDFGADTGLPIPIWLFFDPSGNHILHNVINSIPSDPGYSAFWQVVNVSVPAGFAEDTITSSSAIPVSYQTTLMNTYVNCPVVYTYSSPPPANPTSTPTSTPSSTPTSTPSSTPTSTPSSTPTSTPSSPPTSTPTSTTPSSMSPAGAGVVIGFSVITIGLLL